MADFNDITHLTFDCYGTLIDWETGLLRALAPLFERRGLAPSAENVLQHFVRLEARLECGAWQPYREVLRGVLAGLAEYCRITLTASEAHALADSLPDWPPFADTVEALRRLQRRFKLIIVSNTDDALFAGTARRLGVPFDAVITAEAVRAYKPAEAHFREALRQADAPAGKILHVAQSLYHDHVPAQRLGFRTARIDRPSRLTGTGLAPAASVTPDWSGCDLTALAGLLGA